MGGAIGIGSSDPNAQISTPNPQEICIHAWLDVSEDDTTISQKCVRCGKERIVKK